jgi:hypothetical protein
MLHGGGVRANSLKRRRLRARAIRTTRRRHWTRRLSRLARHGLVLVAEDQIEFVWKARTLAPGLFAVAACRPLLVALRPVSTGPSMAVVWCRRDAARQDTPTYLDPPAFAHAASAAGFACVHHAGGGEKRGKNGWWNAAVTEIQSLGFVFPSARRRPTTRSERTCVSRKRGLSASTAHDYHQARATHTT